MGTDQVGGPDGVDGAASGVDAAMLDGLDGRLRRLRRERAMTLADLVGDPLTGDPRTHPRPSVRHGTTWLPLTGRPGLIQAYGAIPPAGFGAGGHEQHSHEGYAWVHVLAGRLRLRLGSRDLVLAAGEVAELDTRTPHAFTNPDDTPAEVLMLIGPQGQPAHVRARARGAAAP